jgi:hypothetical protein
LKKEEAKFPGGQVYNRLIFLRLKIFSASADTSVSMFEKPQYFTPQGFRRLAQKPKLHNRPPVLSLAPQTKPGKLSPEAAKVIALAIKSMLHS